jgi:hypothetical protein
MKKRAPMQLEPVGLPMTRFATDILGPLPESDISDYFTKWTEAFPMANMEAKTIVSLLVEEVITRFGVPSYIHSDQGRQYESMLLVKFAVYWEYTKQELHHSTQSLMEWLNGLTRHLQLCLQPMFQSTKTIGIPTSHLS